MACSLNVAGMTKGYNPGVAKFQKSLISLDI